MVSFFKKYSVLLCGLSIIIYLLDMFWIQTPGLMAIILPFLFVEIFYLIKIGKSSCNLKKIQKTKPSFILSLVGIITAIIGFALLIISGGGPEIVNGTYVVENHGVVMKEISEKQYLLLKLSECSFLDGLLLFFSALAMCMIKRTDS